MTFWRVIGGGDKGGIIVREAAETSSSQLQRLETKALVRELQLEGERLKYELLRGQGPSVGWVSTKLKEKELLERLDISKDKDFLDMFSRLSSISPMASSRWLAKYQHKPESRCRLICFFGAGMDATGFLHWNDFVQERYPFIEILLLVLPGHGINRNTTLEKDAKSLARATADELISLSAPWATTAIFGFSAGATAGLALALELQKRQLKVLRLYCAGRAGPSIRFQPPNHEEIWAYKPIQWARWFAKNFATPKDIERTEKLIKLSDGEDDGLLKSISETQRADMLLGDSLASDLASEKVDCDLLVIGSTGDEIWPAESSYKYGFCQPPYDDMLETWRGCSRGNAKARQMWVSGFML